MTKLVAVFRLFIAFILGALIGILGTVGTAYFYLVRGHDAGCGGGGSLGTDGSGAPRPSACP